MLKIVIHTAFAIIISSYLIWSNVNAEETLSVTQSPEATEEVPTQSFLSSASDSHFEKDFSVSVGVKMWMNQWSYPALGNNNITQYTSRTKTTLIPILSIRTKNWLVSGSYFTNTKYDFESQSFADAGGFSMSPNYERTEWDINTGYYLHQYLLVTAGYKKIERTFTLDINTSDFSITDAGLGTESVGGPTLGISSVVPLQGRFNLYGNFSYGRSTDYYLGEMGIGYSFKIAKVIDAASVSMGYRFQSMYYDDDKLKVRDGTEGFALGLIVTF